MSTSARGAPAEVIELDWRDEEQIVEHFHERSWTDGLPIVPPTPERVRKMLGDDDPLEVLGAVPPRGGLATLETVACNAVMAGCLPPYFPIVKAAVRAMLHPQFNLYGVQMTASPAGPGAIVSGPIAERLGIRCGTDVFGPGNRPAASIGRALRLVMITLGGGISGEVDKACMGHPGKLSFCFAEDERATPWEPLRIELGYRPEDSTVTVVNVLGPEFMFDHAHGDPEGILHVFADSMLKLGNIQTYQRGQKLLVVTPNHAHLLADGGYDKRRIRDYLMHEARRPLAELMRGGMVGGRVAGQLWKIQPGDDAVPALDHPDDLLIVVAGGTSGSSSAYVNTWSDANSLGDHPGKSRAVTELIA